MVRSGQGERASEGGDDGDMRADSRQQAAGDEVSKGMQSGWNDEMG